MRVLPPMKTMTPIGMWGLDKALRDLHVLRGEDFFTTKGTEGTKGWGSEI